MDGSQSPRAGTSGLGGDQGDSCGSSNGQQQVRSVRSMGSFVDGYQTRFEIAHTRRFNGRAR